MENKEKRRWIIETAMGISSLSGAKNSDFFLKQANRYIEGEITIQELNKIIYLHYSEESNK